MKGLDGRFKKSHAPCIGDTWGVVRRIWMQCLSLVGPTPGRVLRARLSFIHLSIRRFIPGGSGHVGKTQKPFSRWSTAFGRPTLLEGCGRWWGDARGVGRRFECKQRRPVVLMAVSIISRKLGNRSLMLLTPRVPPSVLEQAGWSAGQSGRCRIRSLTLAGAGASPVNGDEGLDVSGRPGCCVDQPCLIGVHPQAL
jgi:hypothetical protein